MCVGNQPLKTKTTAMWENQRKFLDCDTYHISTKKVRMKVIQQFDLLDIPVRMYNEFLKYKIRRSTTLFG